MNRLSFLPIFGSRGDHKKKFSHFEPCIVLPLLQCMQGCCKVLKTEDARQHQGQREENFRGFFVLSPKKIGDAHATLVPLVPPGLVCVSMNPIDIVQSVIVKCLVSANDQYECFQNFIITLSIHMFMGTRLSIYGHSLLSASIGQNIQNKVEYHSV